MSVPVGLCLGVTCFVSFMLLGSEAAERQGAAVPKTLPPTEIGRRIASLPNYAHFGFSGVAFDADRLYVTTNIGLIEVQGTSVKSLHSWYLRDDVLEWPWADRASKSLWLQHIHDGVLRRLDETGWHLVALPAPPNAYGYYTRGDMVAGFHVTSDATGLHLVGADHVWTWSPPDRWILDTSPSAPEYSGSVGVAFSRGREARIMRLGSCFGGPLPCDYAFYWRNGQDWSEPRTLPMTRPSQILGTADGVFARDDKGELVRLDDESAVVLETPGKCEAVALTSSGKLMASFVGAGVFTLTSDGWTKILDSPYGPSEGEHRAYLAEKDGTVAYATDGKLENSGTTALWVAEGGRWTRIDVEHAAKN
ncbi:hypothetical protein SAMN05216330_104108 [Bradyrhizobium sp. Ghvi]|nr:hypothetical protein SAMN05216330_104108 [Bradyrhizobium sp. Ghvi]